jgi:hypothetical protein
MRRCILIGYERVSYETSVYAPFHTKQQYTHALH